MSAKMKGVLQCPYCNLVQFRSFGSFCRRCKNCLFKAEEPAPTEADPTPAKVYPSGPEIQVGSAVSGIRRARNLTQRNLASRAGVQRTYISKIERSECTPRLQLMEKLAAVLEVSIAAFVLDITMQLRHQASILADDPFLAELAAYASLLSVDQRSGFVCSVREMAERAGRKFPGRGREG